MVAMELFCAWAMFALNRSARVYLMQLLKNFPTGRSVSRSSRVYSRTDDITRIWSDFSNYG